LDTSARDAVVSLKYTQSLSGVVSLQHRLNKKDLL
jgi:hypothetical protein